MPIGNREHEITRVEAPAVIRDDEGEPAPSRAELHPNVLGPAVFHSIGQQFLGRAVDQWLRRGAAHLLDGRADVDDATRRVLTRQLPDRRRQSQLDQHLRMQRRHRAA
ncbi:Uncharacterised protein [Mycobacteroides abscessus subsp. abscessus]|nr:Uncharacterised protein [Mycobacteroides abscessus subsp. abscessus]